MKKGVLIMVAAGSGFRNFNTVYRDNSESVVVSFPAARIPNIAERA